MFNNTSNGYGLGQLQPLHRLLIVVISTSAFAFINSLYIALFVFFFGLTLLLLNKTVILKKVLLFLLASNTIYMVVGNALFSPTSMGGFKYGIFFFNAEGLINGIIGALKRNAMILVSFAWLSCTNMPELRDSLAIFARHKKTITIFLKQLQKIKYDIMTTYHSLFIRGFYSKWWDVYKKIQMVRFILISIVRRIFTSVGKLAFAGENHFIFSKYDPKFNGEVVIRDLKVKYDDHLPEVLKGINLKIKSGEFVFIGGLEGSGKTTLLKTICGYIPKICGIRKGDVYLSSLRIDNNIQLKDISKLTRFISDTPDDLIIGLTVGQEIMSITDDRSIALQCLKIMGIDSLWDRETINLSGGERARLVLAGILASKAKIIVLDSPLAQLDPKGRKSFSEALTKIINNQSTTVIVTDYHLNYFKEHINRFIILEHGKIALDVKTPINYDDSLLNRCGLSSPKLSMRAQQVRANMMPNVVVSNLCVTINGNQILKNIDFKIFPGECVAVMGENGSGKTTLMLTIARIIRTYKGSVVINGDIGYVFQNPSLQIVENSILRELSLGPKLKNWPIAKIKSFVENQLLWIGFSESDDILDLHPAKIQMLAITSMNTNVSTLILDEPTAGMDTIGLKNLADYLYLSQDKGVSIIIVTHDERIAKIASKITIMRNGSFVETNINSNQALSIIGKPWI